MEQDNRNINVDGLMSVIKEDYAVKSKSNVWVAGLFCLVIVVNLLDGFFNYSTMSEFINDVFSQMVLGCMLIVVFVKNIYWYRKISESNTPEELLTNYRKNMKLDKIMLCVIASLYLALYYIRNGFAIFFWILLAFFSILFYFFFFGRSLKDKNIEELSGLVEQEVGSSAPNV